MEEMNSSNAALPLKLVVSGHSLAYCDGGIPAYAIRLLEACTLIEPLRVDVLLTGDTPPPVEGSNLHYHWIPEVLTKSRPLPRQFATTVRIGLHARRKFPDSVLVCASDFWCPIRPSKSVVVTHDMLPELDASQAGSWARRLVRKACMRFAYRSKRWLTISDFAADEIVPFFPNRRPEVLENWLSRDYSQPIAPDAVAEARHRLRLPDSFIVYIGGYRAYKKLDLLLKVHAKACQVRPQTSPLVLVGDAPVTNQIKGLDPEAEACLRSGLANGRVFTIGKVSDGDIRLIYAAARFFVSASLHEGFGYPPVEAIHSGCPVLVADRTAFKHVVPNAHCRFDPDSFDGFMAKLLEADSAPNSFLCAPDPLHRFESGVSRLRTFLQSLD